MPNSLSHEPLAAPAAPSPGAASLVPPFRYRRIWLLGIVLMPSILFLDVPIGENPNWLGQNVGSLIGWGYLAYIYSQVSRRFQKFISFGLVWAVIGEVMLCYGFGMYEYRFENIPFYVPPGHVAAMIVSYHFCRERWVIQHQKQIIQFVFVIGTAYVLSWLWFQNDVYGAAMYPMFLAVAWAAKESRLFFMVIFAVTTYMELIGTSLGCWYWHETLMDRAGWPAGGNPPSGIVFLYIFFDVAVLGSYLSTHLRARARYDGRKRRLRKQRWAARKEAWRNRKPSATG